MRDTKTMNDLSGVRRRRDDGLGPNSDIGNKLRALYGAVQDEGIPSQLLDLLDKLDQAEAAQKTRAEPRAESKTGGALENGQADDR